MDVVGQLELHKMDLVERDYVRELKCSRRFRARVPLSICILSAYVADSHESICVRPHGVDLHDCKSDSSRINTDTQKSKLTHRTQMSA